MDLTRGEFTNLSRDVVSDLYQYQQPIELYKNRKLNRVWNQEYRRILPEWSRTLEPWILAAEYGDVQLLEELLALEGRIFKSSIVDDDGNHLSIVAEAPVLKLLEDDDQYIMINIDGLEYTPDILGLIDIAVDRANREVALVLGDYFTNIYRTRPPGKLEQLKFVTDEDYIYNLGRLALLRNDYLEEFVNSNPYLILWYLRNYYLPTRKIIQKAKNKGLIDDQWWDRLSQLTSSRSNDEINNWISEFRQLY